METPVSGSEASPSQGSREEDAKFPECRKNKVTWRGVSLENNKGERSLTSRNAANSDSEVIIREPPDNRENDRGLQVRFKGEKFRRGRGKKKDRGEP